MSKDCVSARYEERECMRCFGGLVYVGRSTEVKLSACPACSGTGRVSTYLYPKPVGFRGIWPPIIPTTTKENQK